MDIRLIFILCIYRKNWHIKKIKSGYYNNVIFMKNDLIIKIGITFYLSSFLGYLYELILCYIYNGKIFSHGFFFGPWLPIYGFGALLIMGLQKYQDKPLVIFFLSFFLSGLLEGISGYLLLKVLKTRLWDYTGYIFNIGGYVCLLSAFCFGIGGVILTYIINPLVDKLLKMVNKKKIREVLSLISGLFGLDVIATSLK